MYEFHYDYIKNKYDNKSKLLFTSSDSLMYENKLKMFIKNFVAIKKCFISVIMRLSQNAMKIKTKQLLQK